MNEINPYQSPGPTEPAEPQPRAEPLSLWASAKQGGWYGLKWGALIYSGMILIGLVVLIWMFFQLRAEGENLLARPEFRDDLLVNIGGQLYGFAGFSVFCMCIGFVVGCINYGVHRLIKRR